MKSQLKMHFDRKRHKSFTRQPDPEPGLCLHAKIFFSRRTYLYMYLTTQNILDLRKEIVNLAVMYLKNRRQNIL